MADQTVANLVHVPRQAARPACAVYTVKEAATMLSLSLGITYGLVRDGSIPAIRMGGRWLIPRRAFHAWLDSVGEVNDPGLR